MGRGNFVSMRTVAAWTRNGLSRATSHGASRRSCRSAGNRSALRYEVGWYRGMISIPKNSAWENKRVIITIGAADFFTDAWCNGKFLGHHEGGYTPFEFDVTDALSPPDEDGVLRGCLVLRVEDPMDNHEQPVAKQWRWYTSTSGIWQTVYIEPRAT